MTAPVIVEQALELGVPIMYIKDTTTMGQQASIAQARAELSALVNKVAHGKERIVLTSRGRPKAALVGLEDLEALGGLPTVSSRLAALRAADELVEAIRLDRRGKRLNDSAQILDEIREERVSALTS